MIAMLVLQAAAAAPALDVAQFEAPVRLLADGRALNEIEHALYPSPVLFDFDRDGARELVVGDLFGSIRIYESLGGDDLAWSAPRNPQVDGEELVLPNW
jgi:hypothetical protein